MSNSGTIKKVFKIIFIVFVIMFFSKIYYDLKLYDLTYGMFQLERKRKPLVLVSKKSITYISKGTDMDEVLIEEMESNGWEYINKYGRGYLFNRGIEELVLFKKDYFGRYSVYEIEGTKSNKEEFRKMA